MMEHSEHQANTAGSVIRPMSRMQRIGLWGILLIWVAAILGLVYVWGFLEHSLENAIRNLVTVSMAMFLTLVTLAWWILLAPISHRIRWSVAVPGLVLLAGFVGSVSNVDMSGDMFPDLTFRWEESAQERFDKFQSGKVPVPVENVVVETVEMTPEDAPAFRGANRDGILVSPPINKDWKAKPPLELWRHPCGGGYASFAIVGKMAITIEQRRDQEAVVCYNIDNGQELWVHEYPAEFLEFAGGPGPRSTPTVEGNSVYVVGAVGDVCSLELTTGKPRWSKNMLKDLNLPNATWAMTSSPLVVGDMLIVNPGGKNGNGLLAYNKRSGEILWKGAGLDTTGTSIETPISQSTRSDGHGQQGNAAAGYSSPTRVTLAGVEQILNFDGMGLHGNDPLTGQELWFFPTQNDPLINVAQPIVLEGDRILISASYGTGAKLLQISHAADVWKVKEVWANQNLKAKFSNNLLLDGYVYGLDEGIMVCLDPNSGERRWKGGSTPLRGRYSHGQMLAADGMIIVGTEKGELVLIEPSPDKLIEVAHIKALSGAKVWNPLAMAHGYLLLRNAEEIVCYDLRLSATPGEDVVASFR